MRRSFFQSISRIFHVNNCSNCFDNHSASFGLNVYAYQNTNTWNSLVGYLGGIENSALNIALKVI